MRANIQRLPVLLFLLMFAGTAAWARWPTDLTHGNNPSLAPLVKKVTPAVVNISVVSHSKEAPNPLFQDPFFRRFFPNAPDQQQSVPLQATGSGVIIDADKGYILTNNHVIENADKITVTLKDKRQFQAKLIGTDKGTDIALLQIKAKHLTALPLGNSDNLEVGDYVVAIGDPFGLGQTVTSGIVSALGRTGLHIEGRSGYEDFIQTDASINPGNSGGALVDLNGHLIGINTAIVSPSGGGNVGIGFAVPINMAKAIESQLIKYGKVKRGQLGVQIQTVTPDLASALGLKTDHGVVINQVVPGSAAEKAGLKANDVIVQFDGKKVEGAEDLRNKVGVLPIGQQVTMTVLRNGHRMKVTATIGEASASTFSPNGGATVNRLRGAQFRNMTPDDPQYGQVQGVVVSQVAPGSRAARNGLRQGDIVTAVNRTPVHNVQEFTKAMNSVSGAVALTIVRGNARLFMVIQ